MYRFLVWRHLGPSIPVLIRDIVQDVVDAEVRFVRKDSLTVGAERGLVSRPVAAETGQTEAVSTRYGGRVGEDVPTQRAQEVLLIQQADCRGHA